MGLIFALSANQRAAQPINHRSQPLADSNRAKKEKRRQTEVFIGVFSIFAVIFVRYLGKKAKKMAARFFRSPAILNSFLRRKTQNFAVKSNSENRFTFSQKNSEYAIRKQKKIDKNGKNLSFAEFLKNKSELLVFSFMMKYI